MRALLLLALMLAIALSRAQNISGCEYFFDTDPGVGNGTSLAVTAGDSVMLNTSIPTGSLSNGFHKLYVRVINTNGKWSLYEGRSFYIKSAPVATLPQLIAAEHFFDTDPGVGNGTAFTVSTADSLIINTSVSTTSLSNGFHKLYVRAQNAAGKWSLYEGRTIYVQLPPVAGLPQLTAAEYFFDSDPGVGNGTAFTVSTGDSLVINTSVPTTSLSNGFHKLYVRAQNTNGKWSLYEGRTIYIQAPVTASVQLSAAEYFYDTDPGIGNATALTVTTGDSLAITTSVATTSLGNGFHRLFVRAKNTLERWSLSEGRTIFIQQGLTTPLPLIVAAEYFFDAEPGIGLATPLVVVSGDSVDASFVIPESLPLGNHSIVLRVQNASGTWSLSEARDFTVSTTTGMPVTDSHQTTLFQNYPNPFSDKTVIAYYLTESRDVSIFVYDQLGNMVLEVTNEGASAGKHSVEFDSKVLGSGYYFYKMVTGGFTDTKRMAVIE